MLKGVNLVFVGHTMEQQPAKARRHGSSDEPGIFICSNLLFRRTGKGISKEWKYSEFGGGIYVQDCAAAPATFALVAVVVDHVYYTRPSFGHVFTWQETLPAQFHCRLLKYQFTYIWYHSSKSIESGVCARWFVETRNSFAWSFRDVPTRRDTSRN